MRGELDIIMQPSNVEIYSHLVKCIYSCKTIEHIDIIAKFINRVIKQYELPEVYVNSLLDSIIKCEK